MTNHDLRRQMAFVVRSLMVDGLPEAFSQQVDAAPGSDIRLVDLFESGWTVVATEAMPGGSEPACLIVVEAPETTAPYSEAAAKARSNSRSETPFHETLELHAPNLVAWDGETISLERLGYR